MPGQHPKVFAVAKHIPQDCITSIHEFINQANRGQTDLLVERRGRDDCALAVEFAAENVTL